MEQQEQNKDISPEPHDKADTESIGGVSFGNEISEYSVGGIFETRFTLSSTQPERDRKKSAQQSSTCVILPKYEVPRAELSGTTTTHENLEVSAIIRDITGGNKVDVRIEAAPDPEFFTPGDDFESRFQIRETFAKGGFGTVSNAYDRALARKVAVKTLQEKHQKNPDAIRRFINEARLTAQLDHPSIVPVYSFEKDSRSDLHLSMKLIDGITLKTFISRIRVKHRIGEITQDAEHRALRSRLELFIKICEAVEFAHSRKIVHGDLKPENIMIGSYGEVYVMDWGTATEVGTVYSEGINGTPAYLAPELCATKTVTKSADIFALGLILFELVTLKYAFTGQTDHEVIMNICTGNIRQAVHTNPEIGIAPDMAAIIRKAAEHDPEKRYRTAAELKSDIRRFLFDEEVSANPRTLLHRIARKMYQKKALTFSAACAILAVTALYIAFSESARYRTERRAATTMQQHLNFQRITGSESDEIEKALNIIEDRLKISAGILSVLIDTRNSQPPDTPQQKTYRNSDYMSPSTSPQGMRSIYGFSKLASLEYPSIHNSSIFDDTPCRMPMPGQLFIPFPELTCSILDNGGKSLSPEEMKKRLISGGTFLRKQYIVLKKHFITYPGMYEVPDAASQENWLPQTEDNIIQWRGPFSDKTSEKTFLTCSIRIAGTDGKEKAVAGVEVDFGKLLGMLKPGRDSGLKSDIVVFKDDSIISYVPEESGNAIFNTSDEKDCNELMRIKNELANGKRSQIVFMKNNLRYIASGEKIPSFNGTYIRLVNEEALYSAPANLQ